MIGLAQCAAGTAALLLAVTMAAAAGDGLPLPPPSLKGPLSVEYALAKRRSVRGFAEGGLELGHAAQLLWAGQGITHPDGLRTAPSAGATYPLELLLVAGAVVSVPPGVYRYEPGPHRLALALPGDRRRELAEAALGQGWIARAPAVVVIAAIVRRTTARYGDRGRRYVHIEAGHAAENIALQAVALGLGSTVVGAFADDRVALLLGLGDAEPLLLIPVGRPD